MIFFTAFSIAIGFAIAGETNYAIISLIAALVDGTRQIGH